MKCSPNRVQIENKPKEEKGTHELQVVGVLILITYNMATLTATLKD
jgi:hypothetical protein